MEELNQQAVASKKSYSRGIVNIKPSLPKSDEEIQKALEEMHDRQFDAHVMHVGRRGNIVIPMD